MQLSIFDLLFCQNKEKESKIIPIDPAIEFQEQLDKDTAYWKEQEAGIKAWNNSY
jgi:hypothetical protein